MKRIPAPAKNFDELAALQKRVKELEAENAMLKEQSLEKTRRFPPRMLEKYPYMTRNQVQVEISHAIRALCFPMSAEKRVCSCGTGEHKFKRPCEKVLTIAEMTEEQYDGYLNILEAIMAAVDEGRKKFRHNDRRESE